MVSFVAFTFLIHLECIYVLGLFLAPLPQNERVLPSNLHWGWSSASFEAGGGVGGGTAAPELTATLERCLVTPFRTTRLDRLHAHPPEPERT